MPPNPFDSDSDESVPPSFTRASSSNPFYDDDDDGGAPRETSSNLPSAKGSKNRSLVMSSNPFDDSSDDGEDMNPTQSESTPAFERPPSRASASGNSAIKKVRLFLKVTTTGTRQASKGVGGAMTHAQKKLKNRAFRGHLEEGTHHRKKVDDSDHKDVVAADGGRYELLDEEEKHNPGSSSNCEESVDGRHYEEDRFTKQELEYRNMEELEGYALQKSGETTSTLQNCLRVAGEIQDSATKTLLTLHGQGEQIKRTHQLTVDISEDLGRSEKLLGTLGGIFSKKWKPKKSQPIVGPSPLVSSNDPVKRRASHLEQRLSLGLNATTSSSTTPNPRLNQVTPNPGEVQTITQQKLDAERMKQDDALTKLSEVLDTLKGLSVDMGSEISSQTDAMDELDKDSEILNERIKGANRRGQRLLGR